MRVTRCEVTLAPNNGTGLMAGAKVVTRKDGSLHVGFPDQPVCDRCPGCHAKTPVTHKHCHNCGVRLKDFLAPAREDGRSRVFTDICFAIVAEFRNEVAAAVLAAYSLELSKSVLPGYEPRPVTVAFPAGPERRSA